MTVLYVHGLESGPQGRKVRNLRTAGFHVIAEQMPCTRKQIVRDPLVHAWVALAIVIIAGAAIVGGPLGFATATAAAIAVLPFARSRLARRVMRRSIDVQKRALATEEIDMVIGSSFGGAVAVELLSKGLWAGPTLLLCPAQRRFARWCWRSSPSLPQAVADRVVVVHGRRDGIVPLADSEALVAGSKARLVLIDDDHRLTATATPEGLAGWIAMLQPTQGAA